MNALRTFGPMRRPWLLFIAGVLLIGAVLGSRSTVDISGAEKTAVPFPSLVYGIEAESNGHQASILNLGIGYLNTLQAPLPVDVDGDLLPDVTVAVNLVDTQGLHNPPQPGDIIRPNVEINRFPLELGTTLLGRPSPPLKIKVVFKIYDLQGETDTMTAKFGYDTGPGGSIPGYFQATLDGITDFFSPVTATISTKGDIITQSSAPLWYQGPLTVIGGFQQGAFKADLGLGYAPFPDKVAVTYRHDDAGDHIDYTHAAEGEVDLLTKAVVEDKGERIDVAANVSRLPRTLGLDLLKAAQGGAVHFDTTADGRLPDADVRFKGPLLGDVFDAHLAIEDLPTSMDAKWSLPKDGPINAIFDSSGQGIGAIEAEIQNRNGAPTGLPPFLFAEKQIAAAQLNTATDALRLGARLERIRHAEVAATPAGNVDATINIGDGELPLQLAGFVDLRSKGGPLIDASSTFSPLPGTIGVSLKPAGDNQRTDPLKLVYSASEAVDVDARVLVRTKDATSATCGASGVICGDLRMRHIPTRIEARIGGFTNAEGKQETRIETDTVGPGHVDVFADVKVGPDVVNGVPAQLAGKPLVARLEMLGLARNARVRTIEGQDDTLQRTEFHSCAFDYAADACPAGTQGDRIGALQFGVANFLPTARPADLPPAYAATPNFATITARGRSNGTSVDFEATGRVSDIRELTYVNQGAFGYRSDIGGGGDLATLVDVDNIAFGAGGPGSDLFDVTGNVLIHPLPQRMSFCLNASGQAIVAPPSSITAPCQDKNPFSAAANRPSLTKSPMSVAYDGSRGDGSAQEFDVDVDAELLAHNGAGTDDDRRVRGTLDIDHIPATIHAHVLDPKDQAAGGPLKVLVDAPTLGPQLTVFAKASLLDGDLQCEDPRVPKRIDSDTTQASVCAQGRINNVPNRMTLAYDADAATDNFVLDGTGEKQLSFTDLKVAAVTRDEPTADDPPGTAARAQVLVATGEILGLPKRVEGTLKTPAPGRPDDPVLIDLTGTPLLVDQINASVRNFIAPDPIPDMPAQRQGLADPKAIGGDGKPAGDWASFIQRGDAFKADVHVSSIKRVSFKNQVDANGKALDTSVVSVDFGKDKVVRGYVDIDKDGTDRLIGDVTIEDIPAGIQVCVRPPTTKNITPAAGTATFCDNTPAPVAARAKTGAFEARMSSAVGAQLDVDAFVRSAKGGGADILSARVDIDNIPNVVRGTFGDGKVDVGGFTLAGVPDGIDRIYANAASFDLSDDLNRSDDGDGWTPATRPYSPRFVTRTPFPTPFPAGQHVAVRADDADFEVRARIGAVEPSVEPASDLHRIQLSDTPCGKPVGVDYGSGAPDYGPRPDFPFLPDDGSKYTCIRGDFEPVGPTEVDPLDLSVIIDKGGKRLSLEKGLLDDIPEFFQVNVADANPLQNQDDRRLRPHCIGLGRTQPANCVAPLVRLDTPGNARLSGIVQYGALADLGRLGTVRPREALPVDVDSAGNIAFAGNEIRARIGSFGASTAARAAFRIPIPASFTIDQVQSWSMSNVSGKPNYLDASDLHFRYAARNPDGSSIGVLLKLSAMIHSSADGTQILLSDDDPSQGVQIPGDLGVEMFTRNHNGNGRNFLQIDGRSTAPDLDLRARLLGTGGSPIGRLDAQVRNVPPAATAYPATNAPLTAYGEPSFRIRAETLGEGKEPPDPSGADSASGGEPPKEKECSPLLCILTQVRLKSVNVQFDFKPGTSPTYARLLEAVIRTDGTKNGVEVRGFSVIDNDVDNDGVIDQNIASPFLAGAQLDVDPINLFVHAGIPLLASLDFILLSDLDAAASVGGNFKNGTIWSTGQYDPGGLVPQLEGAGSTNFSLKQNLLKMTVSNNGPDGSFSQIGPIDFNVKVMHGEAWGLFVKLLGVDWVPPGSSLRLPFIECSTLGALNSEVVKVPEPLIDGDGDGSRSVVPWPFYSVLHPPGKIVYSGLLGGALTLVGDLAGPFFCVLDTDQDLIDDGAKPHPADPLGIGITQSKVPEARVDGSQLVQSADDTGPDLLPDITVGNSTPAMCGTKSYNNFTIPSGVTLNVATAADATKIDGVDACPAGAEGTVEIVATGNVTVNGVLEAGNRMILTNASGNGGGGHGVPPFLIFPEEGRGGNGGTSGSGGPAYGDRFGDFDIEVGRAGSATTTPAGNGGDAGKGGGSIKIIADKLSVGPSGAVRADGGGGSSKGTSPADCFDPDVDGNGPDTGHPNIGFAGGGGGAGGGIVLHLAEYAVAAGGSVSVNGGPGGAGSRGGGGGGGGGNVKLDTALVSGAVPTATGGAGGADLCGGNNTDDPGTAGGGGDTYGNPPVNVAPKSRVDIRKLSDADLKNFSFWNTTAGDKSLVVPYQAAAEVVGASDDFDVVLCATPRTTAIDLPTDKSLSEVLMPAQPGNVSLDNPCGTFGIGTIVGNPGLGQPGVQAVKHFSGRRTTSTFSVASMAESYYGLYTMLWKTTADGNDCFNPFDQGYDPFNPTSGRLFDVARCTAEPAPTSPDLSIGIDNAAPNIQNLVVNGVTVRGGDGSPVAGAQPVSSSAGTIAISWNDTDNLSKVVGRECTGANGAIGFRNCVSGQTVAMTNGDGTKTVAVRLIDGAGNTDTFTATVLVDTTVPASSGQVMTATATQLQNGWFLSSPGFRLFGYNDGAGTGAPAVPWEYQFDDGDLKPCNDLDCTIGDGPGEDLPGIGRHRLRWTAIDKVGNKFTADDNPNTPGVDGRQQLAVKVDGAKPISALLSVPATPNGANGWYSGATWITFGAFDQPGASGFKKAVDDTTQIGGVAFQITHEGVTTPGTFDVANPSPVRLEPGTSTVCWQAKDQAGNVDLSMADQCRTFKVDEADPVTSLPTTANTPDGVAGWYTTKPVVNPTVADGGTLGSGVGTDTVNLCTQNPLIAAPAPTGTCISIDGAPFIPVDHNADKYLVTLGEGLHEMRAFSTDAAGRRSAITTRLYQVDLSNPVAVARTIMARASAGKWWREVPTVVLRAADGDQHGSGIVRTRYQFSGTAAVAPCTAAPCTYTGPFTVPEGVYRVTYWAEDVAGRVQAPQTLKVAVDTTPPVPKATTPNPALWLRSKLGLPLTSPTVDLRWTLQENLSGVASADNTPPDRANVKVVVYDVTGFPVRTLNAGDFVVTPGQTLAGKAVWDGKGANLTSLLPVGTYYYRVVATDAAGNVAMSGESTKLVIAVSLLL